MSVFYDLEDIKSEFLKYAPGYARNEAGEALDKLIELQSQGLIRNGVYYIVLVDLVDSTKYAGEFGNDRIKERIKTFVTASFAAMVAIKITNIGIFLKEIGDAVLYIFQHFTDFLKWRYQFENILKVYGQISNQPFIVRTCIHIGEVSLEGVNPLCIAVSQTFKMEKSVNANDIVLTDTAYQVAWPTIRRAYHGFSDYGEIQLEGYREMVKLHQLNLHDPEDLKRIIDEQNVKV